MGRSKKAPMQHLKCCKNKKARYTRQLARPVQRATAVAEGDSQALGPNLHSESPPRA